ncbi:kelch repeat F-box protein [Rhynchospora pubera]|uniref:Kelch repeat F-box protein n=1 Tax=Rhynchospora pubera TaxID=906938 RepID=A0AAV8C7P6_9POAL|nr:kelch repeat F-box protein [Rhynchospora pubera]
MEDQDPPSTRLIPDLPDEISVQIIARVPRSNHQTLCHVSRSWRLLLLGRLLFTLRSSLHCIEPTLYLHIRTHTENFIWISRWLVLNRGHSQFQSLPPPPNMVLGSAHVIAGPFLFSIGGSLSANGSNMVQILDLRIGGQWSLGPRMLSARKSAAACFLDGHIYVIGGCLPSSEVWAESLNLFDENPQWVSIDSPVHLRSDFMYDGVVLSSRILAKSLVDPGVVAYDPSQNTGSCSTWAMVPEGLKLGWKRRSAVVNGILYTHDFMFEIKGYDAGKDKWRPVMGIDIFPKFPNCVQLLNFHGVLCVIWLQSSIENNTSEMVANWVGIGVTDLGSEGLHGSILWREIVALGVPCDSSILHSVVAEF